MIVRDENFLRQKSKKTSLERGELVLKLLKYELEEYNKNTNILGIGLAGVQIKILKRVIYFKFPKSSEFKMINPIIVNKYDKIRHNNEGCLSFPKTYITTERYNEIEVRDDLHKSGSIFEGFEAFAVQHEIDHLDGILFFDRKFTGIRKEKEIGRNDPCICGSGKKYKKCCMK